MSHNKPLVISAGFMLVCSILYTADATRPPAPRRRAPARDPVVEMIESHSEMNRDFEQWFDVAEEIAGTDAHARELVRFARANAVPSELRPGGITHTLVMGDAAEAIRNMERLHATPSLMAPRAFEITVANMETRRSNGMRALADWQYDQVRNELFVPPRRGYSRLYGAAVLLHELQHAYDLCTGAEPETPTPAEWDLGEARAYEVELRILDLATRGEVTRYGRSLVGRYREPGDDRWIWPEDMPDMDPVLLQWSDVLGEPPLTPGEESARGGTLLILLNRELATREELPEDAFLEFIHATRSLPHP